MMELNLGDKAIITITEDGNTDYLLRINLCLMCGRQ